MKQKYTLSSITIARTPGFGANQFPVIEELSDSLNIIYGPNGVGKSTLLRNLRALIYQSEPETESSTVGRLRIGEDVWELERNGKSVKQLRQRDGAIIDLPGVNEEFKESYWFALHELVAPSMKNHTVFFELAKRQMQGGIDLDQAEKDLGSLTQFSGSGLKDAKSVDAKRNALIQSEKIVRGARALSEEITTLEAQLADHSRVATRAHTLASVQSYVRIRTKYENLEAQIATYDSRLHLLRNTNLDSLSILERAVKNAQVSVDNVDKEIVEQTQNLNELDVGAPLLLDRLNADRFEETVREAEALHTQLTRSSEQLLEKQGELESWNSQFAWLASQPPKEEDLQTMVSSLGKLAQTDEMLRSSVQASSALLKRYPSPSEDDRAYRSELIDQKHKLLSLKSAKKQLTKAQQAVYWILLTLIALLAGGGIYLALEGVTREPVVLGALTIMLLTVLGRKVMWDLNSEKDVDLSEALGYFDDASPQSTYDQLLDRCFKELADLEFAAKTHTEAKGAFEVAKKKYEEHVRAYQDAYDSLAIPSDPTLEGSRFFNVGEHLRSWSNLLSHVRSQEKVVEETQKSLDQLVKTLQELAQVSFGDSPVKEARALADRLKKAQAIQENLRYNRTQLEGHLLQLNATKRELTQWHERYNVESREQAEVLFSQMDEYNELADELTLLKRELAGIDEATIEAAKEIDPQTLDLEIEELGHTLKELESLRDHYLVTKERYRTATRATEYEKALYEYDRSVETLKLRQKREIRKRLSHSIIADLKEQTQREHQPAVIQRASAWLGRITHNRYSLTAGRDEFRVLDHVEDRSLSLQELSSGTRIQVLFALRMGYLEGLEEGGNVALPIFFDEIMANSDDERSLAIAEAIGAIAAERQVFYATAQADEVGKLESQTQGKAPLIVNLEELRSQEEVKKQPFTSSGSFKKKEVLFEAEYTTYAKTLKIAQAGLFTNISQLSSWYLCLSSEELYALLQRGLNVCGTARRSSQELAKRFALLKEAQRLAQAGREKVLTVADLSDPRLVLNRSTNYFQQIIDLVEGKTVTGSALLQAIADKEIKNISADTLQTITDWLVEHTFLSEENPLTKDEIIARLSAKDESLVINSDLWIVVERYLEHILAPTEVI